MVLGLSFHLNLSTQSLLESSTIEGDSPVEEDEKGLTVSRVSSIGYLARIWEASTSNPKYVLSPIADKYREGKLKRTLGRELKDPET